MAMKHRRRKATIGMGVLCLALSCVSHAGADVFKRQGKMIPVGPNPCAMVAAHLNGDDILDIVTADLGRLNDPRDSERPANDELSLLLGQKDGSYVRQPLRVEFGPYALAVANMDAQRGLDILVACFHATRNRDLVLLRNIGEALFEPLVFTVPDDGLAYLRQRDGSDTPLFPTPGLTSFVLADFNGDGYRDLVATGWASDVLVYFPGVAEKYFGDPKTIPAPGGPRDIQMADFNRDGRSDLVTTMYSSGEVALWRGEGGGVFSPAGRFSSRGRLPHKVRVADVNRDDRLDLVVTQCYSEDSVVLFYGDGAFGFSLSQEIALGKDPDLLEEEIRDIVVDDFDGNGRPDVALACYGSGRVTVLLNTSTDSSLPQAFLRENYSFPDAKPRALCVGDFNGDGGKDLAVGLWEANAVTLLLGPGKKPSAEPVKKSEPSRKR